MNPIRQCIACRAHFEKSTLIRVVKPKKGDVSLDFIGKKEGRGAYLCNNKACLQKAIKSKALSRIFKKEVSSEIYEQLEKEMEERI